jgi:formate C-acetyltransferase
MTVSAMEETAAQRMAKWVDAYNELGEYFAAGFAETPAAPVITKAAHGIRNYLSRCPLPPYNGELLYPCGGPIWGAGQIVWHFYVNLGYDRNRLAAKRETAKTPEQREALAALEAFWNTYPPAGGYTHSIINFGRVLTEGLDDYARRIATGLDRARKAEAPDRIALYQGLEIVLHGVRRFVERIREMLAAVSFSEPEKERNRQGLLSALTVVPFKPATSFREAMVGTNLLFYLDGSDDLGRFDQDLWPFYKADRDSGRVSRDEALALVKQQWKNVDDCGAWNVCLGGTTPEGTQAANDLTILCLEAGRKRRRPNLALRLRRDTPEEVWDAAFETISTGCGLPALYGEENYIRALHEAHLNLPDRDLYNFAFGGCTETMIHGRSNVGSLDHNINLAHVFEKALHAELETSSDFPTFLARVREHLACRVKQITEEVNANQARKAQWHPQLMRSLLIDDCIENGREYAAGGARYNWSVINVGGLGNIIDSLCAVREVVYEKKEIAPAALRRILKENFEGNEAFRKRLEACPRFGNNDPRADEIGTDISRFVFAEFLRYAPWRGGKFLPSCLMFVTYANEGRYVGATPDGRKNAEPIADSAGAVQGRDVNGPTALIKSVTAIDMVHAPGTLVVNIRFVKRLFKDPVAREKVKALVRSYFALGGLQIQINVVDQTVLREALKCPDQHRDLIVRIGGYSEYFHRLSPDLQLSVLQRTEHE